MKRALIAVLLGCVALGFSSLALAGNNSQAGIAVHIAPFDDTKTKCDSGVPADNSSVNTSDFTNCSSGLYNVYILVCNGSHRNAEYQAAGLDGGGFDVDGTGVAATDFGLIYGPGVFLSGWSSCADGLEFADPGWPNSGFGTTVTWTSCNGLSSPTNVPNNVIAVAGVMVADVLAPELLQLTAKATSGLATVVDCDNVLDVVSGQLPGQLGAAGFCLSGYNPCGLVTPVEETTWGSIKKQFD
jgi:hypothetical protein